MKFEELGVRMREKGDGLEGFVMLYHGDVGGDAYDL
jgi:hypothetical protein